jgi:hypothetical protein
LDIKERICEVPKWLIVFFIIITVSYTANADKTKSALKALEKGEFDKVEEILQKSLAKNTLDPSSKFVYSILYSIDSFLRFNLDSAHFHIINAQKDYNLLDGKDQENLAKDDVTIALIDKQHQHVDSLAYLYASGINSIEAFNYFISDFKDSKQYLTAIKVRNSIAFQKADKRNTWQSFKSFLEEYPKATEVSEAQKKYDKLIFEEKTESGTLEQLESFLEEHPQTPYRNNIEENIFNLLSVLGEDRKISRFIEDYQNPKWQKRGMGILFYLHPKSSEFSKHLKSPKWKFYLDSLSQFEELNSSPWVPFFEDNKYGFADLNGELKLDIQFDAIGEDTYCGNIYADVLEVAIGTSHLLVNRKLDTIFVGDFSNYKNLGNGILKITKNKKVGAIHSTGFSILPFEYEEISVLNKQLLKVRKSGKYGLYGILGKEIIPPEYDNIYISGNYIIFEKDEKISIDVLEPFIQKALDKKMKPVLKYEDFEIINKKVICFEGDKEVLLDSLLNEIIPFSTQRINTKFDTWVIKQPDGYRLFDHQNEKLEPEVYREVIQNEKWLAVIGSNKWSLYSKSLSEVPMVGLDSVNLLGEDIALIFRDKAGMAIFPNKKIVEFSKDEKLRSISSNKNTEVHFLVISRNGKNTLYKNGARVIESVYEIGYISDEVFSAKARGEFGAMDSQARLIMRIRYDAIGEAENGISPVIYNGRFGAYNFNDKILISLKFDEKLKPYNDHLLITKFREKKGLHSIKNENILDTEYDELLYWSDSVALVKNLEHWSLFNFYTEENLLTEMSDFEFISKDEGDLVIKFRTSSGMGVYSSLNGLLFEPTFNDVINIGTPKTPLYFCEKSIPEADYYVAVYKNAIGETVRTHAYRGEEYLRIVCEE